MLSQRLRNSRKFKKLTQEQLAYKVQTQKTTISNYETGYSAPSNEMLKDLANTLDVSVDYLLGRTDIPKNTLTDNVRLFVDSLELTDEQVLDKISLLNVDGSPLTKEEALEFIAFVRAKRSINKE